mmetsp:Transcript_24971/g.68602  ORF Transcript_24971/g.68602 Transcript_24971/m.68602 type:complete len:267 (-) Transcript_24971:822-1622(-)
MRGSNKYLRARISCSMKVKRALSGKRAFAIRAWNAPVSCPHDQHTRSRSSAVRASCSSCSQRRETSLRIFRNLSEHLRHHDCNRRTCSPMRFSRRIKGPAMCHAFKQLVMCLTCTRRLLMPIFAAKKQLRRGTRSRNAGECSISTRDTIWPIMLLGGSFISRNCCQCSSMYASRSCGGIRRNWRSMPRNCVKLATAQTISHWHAASGKLKSAPRSRPVARNSPLSRLRARAAAFKSEPCLATSRQCATCLAERLAMSCLCASGRQR